jgi:hypothetical protein
MGDAQRSFEAAWEASSNDYEACIAAHYVARHQRSAEAALHWNREALRRADLVADDRVRGLYASLYLNVGRCLELLGDSAEACRHFSLAAARLGDLPDDGYGKLVRGAVSAGRQRACVR